MILNVDQIRAVTKGADRVELNTKGRIKFHRFTEAQEKAYKDYSAEFYRKTFATSGIRLEFVTDSKRLAICSCTHISRTLVVMVLTLYRNKWIAR